MLRLAVVRECRGLNSIGCLDVFEGGSRQVSVELSRGAAKVLYLKLGELLLGDTH